MGVGGVGASKSKGNGLAMDERRWNRLEPNRFGAGTTWNRIEGSRSLEIKGKWLNEGRAEVEPVGTEPVWSRNHLESDSGESGPRNRRGVA